MMFHMSKKLLIGFLILPLLVFTTSVNWAFASEQPSMVPSKIITNGDLYVDSKESLNVPFRVSAIDDLSKSLPVECDKTSTSIFKMGKTTVRCTAVDSSGNMIRNSFVVTVGYNIVQIPNWFKQITQFWINQNISDEQYAKTLDFLLSEKVIHVPTSKFKNATETDIPIWIRANAQKWINDEISDDEFAIVLDWLTRHKMQNSRLPLANADYSQ